MPQALLRRPARAALSCAAVRSFAAHLRGKKPAEMAPILASPETRVILKLTLATFAGSIRVRPRPVIS
jgi:hypothetical protein